MKAKTNYNFTSGAMKANKIISIAVGIEKMFIVAIIVSFFTFCGNKKETPKAPEGMHTLDLSRYGKPFAIFVPDTIKTKLTIIEQSSGSLDIKVGNTFAISINEQPADMELRKKDIKEDEINKFKSFVKEEPNAIMWESAITDPEFHFLINQKVGNSEYSFEDTRDTQANPPSKDAIQKMFDSSKNIIEVKKENS
jgi:hypothetical protein